MGEKLKGHPEPVKVAVRANRYSGASGTVVGSIVGYPFGWYAGKANPAIGALVGSGTQEYGNGA